MCVYALNYKFRKCLSFPMQQKMSQTNNETLIIKHHKNRQTHIPINNKTNKLKISKILSKIPINVKSLSIE